MATFTAIDFETANQARNTACAVGVVVVSRGRIVAGERFLIRPHTRRFVLSTVHGLTWADVRAAPSFEDLWPRFRPFLSQSDFVATHSGFDRSVLKQCCESFGLRAPKVPFVCTMKLARAQWNIYPTTLPDVCAALRIRLQDHHDPLADAEACAHIVMRAQKEGWRFKPNLV